MRRFSDHRPKVGSKLVFSWIAPNRTSLVFTAKLEVQELLWPLVTAEPALVLLGTEAGQHGNHDDGRSPEGLESIKTQDSRVSF